MVAISCCLTFPELLLLVDSWLTSFSVPLRSCDCDRPLIAQHPSVARGTDCVQDGLTSYANDTRVQLAYLRLTAQLHDNVMTDMKAPGVTTRTNSKDTRPSSSINVRQVSAVNVRATFTKISTLSMHGSCI